MRLNAFALLIVFTFITLAGCGGGEGPTPTSPTYPTGKPSGIKVTAGDESATISWNPVPGASGYYVYISENGVDFSKYHRYPITNTTFQIFNLINGNTYYFAVTAVGSNGWETSLAYPGGAPTAVKVVPADPGIAPNPEENTPPAPPKNLQGVAKDASVELEWDSNTESDFSFYRVYRRDDTANPGGDFTLARDGLTTNYFRNTDLTNDHKYSYYVTAVDNESPALESEASNIISLKPLNFPPEPLKNLAIFVNAGRIVLEWGIPEEADIAKYAIQRVEGVEAPTGVEVISRFVIDKPTQGVDNPHIYGQGLIETYVDVVRDRIVLIDKSVVVGVIYKYRIAAIDKTKKEGPPVQIDAPMAVF